MSNGYFQVIIMSICFIAGLCVGRYVNILDKGAHKSSRKWLHEMMVHERRDMVFGECPYCHKVGLVSKYCQNCGMRVDTEDIDD